MNPWLIPFETPPDPHPQAIAVWSINAWVFFGIVNAGEWTALTLTLLETLRNAHDRQELH